MANVLNDPLEMLSAADIPAGGVPAAPEGDSAGTNPFAGKVMADGPGTPAPAPAQIPTPPPPPPPVAPQDSTPPVNPFAGHQVVDQQMDNEADEPSTDGTAAGSGLDLSGSGAPAASASAGSGAPVATSNPFAGHSFDQPTGSATSRAMADENAVLAKLPPPTAEEKAKQIAVGTYDTAKNTLRTTVSEMADAIQLMWHNPAAASGQLGAPVTVPVGWDEERLKGAIRGEAQIAISALPGLGELAPSLFAPGAGTFFTKKLTGKVLALMANGEIAGAAYGAAAPTEDGETRWDSITNNVLGFGLQTPIFHAAFKTLGWPVGTAFDKLGVPQKVAAALDRYNIRYEAPDIIKRSNAKYRSTLPVDIAEQHPVLVKAAQDVQDILDNVRQEGANPVALPQSVKEDLVAMSIDNAVEQQDHQTVDLDAKTQMLNQASLNLQGPRDVNLPEPGQSEGQTRIAQGVYQNLDGSVEAYGYRGVSGRYVEASHPEADDSYIKERTAIEPGQMGTAFMSPNPALAQSFGDLHYVGARFKNPLIIDNWHDQLQPEVEAAANAANKAIHENSGIPWEPGATEFGGAQLYHPEYGQVGYLGHRQPGVIEAARLLGHDGIIVRHGNEAVEIVALDPGKSMFSAGSADGGAAESLKGDAVSSFDPVTAAPKGWDAVGGNSFSSTIPTTPEQRVIDARARRVQRGVIDLGTSNKGHVISQSPTLKAGKPLAKHNFDLGVDHYQRKVNYRDLPDAKAYDAIMNIVEKHNNINEGHADFGGINEHDGIYKIDGRVYNIKHELESGYTIKDITGQLPHLNEPGAQPLDIPDPFENYTKILSSSTLTRGEALTVESNSRHDRNVYNDLADIFENMPDGVYKIGGMDVKYTAGDGTGGLKVGGHPTFQDNAKLLPKADPTVHPDIIQAAMLHDAISKGNTQADLISQLGPTNQAAAKVLVGFEPNPVGYSNQSLNEKLHIQGQRALDLAAVGHIDDALLKLTAPRELDLERPELSNPNGERTKMRDPSVRTWENTAPIEHPGFGTPKGNRTLEQIYSSGPAREVAMDGRILKETVDEHIRNAIQMLQLGEPNEAAKRLRWAQEKNPTEAARMIDKDSRLVRLNDSPEMAEQRKLAQVKLLPWEQDVLRKYQQLMTVVEKGAPQEIERVQGYITETLENARARAAGAPEIGEDQVGMVNVASTTQVRAPWSPVPMGLAVPQMPSDFAMLARMEESLRNGVVEKTAAEMPGVQPSTKPVKRSSLTGKPLGGNRTGSVNPVVLFRIVSGGSSAFLYGAAYNTENPETRKWLYAGAGFMAGLTLLPIKGGWFDSGRFGKAIMRMNDLPALMRSEVGIPAADKLRTATDIGNYFINTAKTREMVHEKQFPTQRERELAARAMDNPKNLAVWAQLTPEQQQIVGAEGVINHQLGAMLKARGLIDQFRDDYIRHIFPSETYNAYRSAKGSLAPGGFTKPRHFDTFDDAENWARVNGLPGPIIDLPHLQRMHLLEVGKAIMNDQIVKDFKSIGVLIERSSTSAPPSTVSGKTAWRTPAVFGMHDLIAPDAVATALERIGNHRPGILDSQTLRGLDTAKGWIMRSVMAFPWIHGVNVARAALALDGTGVAYNRAMAALDAADPIIAQGTKYGLDLYSRNDYADAHAQGFQALLQKVGSGLPEFLDNKTFSAAADYLKRGEKQLWDRWVPALGVASYSIEMHKWGELTGGQFAEGTPEFTTAARAAADRANTHMGRSLQMLKDPGLVYLMRNIFFAPQWMGSRLRITAAAMGEFRGLATGQIPLQDVKMLPFKVRSLMIGAAFTYIFSKLIGGQAPQFNANNSKFYMRTGVFDSNRREVGVDLAGWYADDIKLFSDPGKFFMNRLSPMIQIAHTAVSGRDAFGRAIGGTELADQTINELGPSGSMADAAARIALQGKITGADAIKGVLSSSDIGSSASLPTAGDVKLQGMAYKLLVKAGLPTDDDRVYELQQLLGSNVRRQMPAVDEAVVSWLANQQKSYQRQSPKSAGARYLFRHVQRVIQDLAK